MARWARRRAAGRVLAIPNQQAGVLARYGVTRDEADRAAWTIEADGRRRSGAAAVNRVMRELGGAWGVVAAGYGFAPLAAVEEAFYRWFAAHRSRFSRFGVTPACDEPGAGCAG